MNRDANQPRRFATARCLINLIAAPMCLLSSAVAVSADQGTVSQLPALLQQQGWRYQSDADGNVYYLPPQPPKASGQAQAASAADAARVDIPRLLRERGWQLESTAQGDMLLLPIKPPALPDIDRMLRERGWRVLTDVDGNTLLMPLARAATAPTGKVDPTATPSVEPVPAAIDPTVARSPTAEFRRALEEKGWTVRAEPDGSTIIHPPGSTPDVSPVPTTQDIAGRGYCQGITLAGDEIALPIEAEEQAKLLGVAWIALFGQADHEVGKARKVNQVFVVSIVDSAPPHTLRNQLVVREDGSIIALY